MRPHSPERCQRAILLPERFISGVGSPLICPFGGVTLSLARVNQPID